MTGERQLLKNATHAEFREAEILLAGVVKAEPSNAAAYGLMGKVQFQLGDMNRAMSAFSTAIRLDPADRGSTYQLMTIYRKAGRSAEASALAKLVRAMLAQEKADEEAGAKFRVVRESGDPGGTR